jgi:hypothetical protein
MAACGEDSREGQFVNDLEAGATYILKDNDLIINMKRDAGKMRFFAEPANNEQE